VLVNVSTLAYRKVSKFVGHRFTVDSVRLPRSACGYTRCSPFDLLFGRSVAGSLSFLKSAWLRETDLQGPKQNVVEFISVTRERLRHAFDLPTEHASKERTKSKLRKSFVAAVTFVSAWARVRRTLQRNYTDFSLGTVLPGRYRHCRTTACL